MVKQRTAPLLLVKPLEDSKPMGSEELPLHILWLIENYNPPSTVRSCTINAQGEEREVLEAVATQYRLRPRRETFIEWLWKNYPPRR